MADLSGLGDLVLTVGGDISPLEDALSGIPEVASAAAAQIQTAFDAIPSATEGVESSLASLSTGLTDAGTAAGEAAGSVEAMPPALHATAEAAGEAETGFLGMSESMQEFLTQGLELAGIALSMEAVKEAILGSLEAFGELQTATVAMDAMTGKTEEVAAAMEQIPALANQIGASIGSLETAFTKFTRYGVDLQQIPAVLSAIADGAMASGVGFDQAATSWERATNTGMLAARSVQSMGISLSEVATAMGMTGATSAQVTAAFKGIQDQSDGTTAATQRLNILLAAMPENIRGLAASSDTVTKAFNALSNTVTDAKETIGAALVSIGNGVVLQGLEDAIRALEIAFLGIIEVVGQVVTVVVGMSKILIDAFIGIGQAMVDIAQGNPKQALADLSSMATKVGSDWTAMSQQMVTNFTTTSVGITKAWDDITKSSTAGGAATKTAADQANEAFQQLNQTLVNAQNAFNVAAAALANGTGTLAAYETALKALNTAQMTVNNGFENAGTAALIAADAYVKLQIGVANAQTTLKAVVTDMDSGTASATQYSAALVALNKVQMELNNGYENAHTALLLAIDDFSKLQVQTANSATTLQAVVTAALNGQSGLMQLDAAVNTAQKDFMAAHNGLQDFQLIVDQVGISMQKAGIAVQNSSGNLQAWLDKLAAGYPVVQQVIAALDSEAAAIAKNNGGLLDAKAATDQLTASHLKLQQAADNANTTLSAAYALYDKGMIGADELATAVNNAAKANDALNASHQKVATAAQAVNTAQTALNATLHAGAAVMGDITQTSEAWGGQLSYVNGQLTLINNLGAEAANTSQAFGGSIQYVNGQLVLVPPPALDARNSIQGIATAMQNVAAAAPGMVAGLHAVAGAAGSLGSQLDKTMNAPIGGMNMSLTTGEQITAPYVGNPFMGGTETGSMMQGGLFGFTGQQETSTYDAAGQAAAINAAAAAQQQAAQQTSTAAAALTSAASTQQTAAQTAYDAAKLATIGANNTITAAQTIVTANDSISASSLAAANAANVQAMAGQALIGAGSTLSTAATIITSASTSLVTAATTLTTAVQVATAPASSTFTPFAPVTGALPNVGPSGGMSGGLSPAQWTAMYQATVGGTGPQNPSVNLTVNAPGFIQSLMNEFVRQLQSQGYTLRRG